MTYLNPQQQHALMGNWVDIIGRRPGSSFRTAQTPWAHRHRRWGGWPYGGMGGGMDGGFDGGFDGGGQEFQPPYNPYAYQYPPQPYPYPYPYPAPVAPVPVPVTMPQGALAPPPQAPDVTPPPVSGLVGCHYGYGGGFPGPIPPRNALVEAAPPGHAGREVLPMSTGVPILPTQSAQITARPQRVAFRPERVFISAAGTSGGAADWVVNDIKIGNRSQFSQSGDVPGDMFATNAIDGFVSFETAQTAMDVVMVVTYIGLNESGVPFFASIVGTAAI